MTQITNIAVVGTGYWGINYVRVFTELRDSRVITVCDANKDRLAVVSERFSEVTTTTKFDDVVANKDIQAVVVATPAQQHFELAKQALKAGKHVLIEKPMTTTVAESRELTDLANKSNLALVVGHTFLYNSGIRKVKELVSKESFGKFYYMHATRTNMGPIRQDVNSAWDLAAHDISIFNYFVNEAPQWASAVGSKMLGGSQEDICFATLGYRNGLIANIHVSWLDPNKVREIVVVGSNQRIVFDDLNTLEYVRIFEKGVVPADLDANSFGEFKFLMRDGDILSPKIQPSEPLKNLAIHFLKCVRGEEKPLTDGTNGADVVRVLCAINKSLEKNGAPVEIEK
jgi:predicted dehydrogenase